MYKVDKILVTTDFSDTANAALGLARQMADKFNAKIFAIHVLDIQLLPLASDFTGAAVGDMERDHREQADEQMSRLAKTLGSDVQTAIASGTPHVEIVRFAEEQGIDLIVIATHGRGFFSNALMGSTTARVLRRASCPVLTVRAPSSD